MTTPATERAVIEAAVNCGYFPLYEVEKGITKLNYNHENSNKKCLKTVVFHDGKNQAFSKRGI